MQFNSLWISCACSYGCFFIFFIIPLTFIPISIGFNLNDSCDANPISISVWLIVFGAVYLCLFMFLVIYQIAYNLKRRCNIPDPILNIISCSIIIFNYTWEIMGAYILFESTNLDNCHHGGENAQKLWNTGLAFWILMFFLPIFFFILICVVICGAIIRTILFGELDDDDQELFASLRKASTNRIKSSYTIYD